MVNVRMRGEVEYWGVQLSNRDGFGRAVCQLHIRSTRHLRVVAQLEAWPGND